MTNPYVTPSSRIACENRRTGLREDRIAAPTGSTACPNDRTSRDLTAGQRGAKRGLVAILHSVSCHRAGDSRLIPKRRMLARHAGIRPGCRESALSEFAVTRPHQLARSHRRRPPFRLRRSAPSRRRGREPRCSRQHQAPLPSGSRGDIRPLSPAAPIQC